MMAIWGHWVSQPVASRADVNTFLNESIFLLAKSILLT